MAAKTNHWRVSCVVGRRQQVRRVQQTIRNFTFDCDTFDIHARWFIL